MSSNFSSGTPENSFSTESTRVQMVRAGTTGQLDLFETIQDISPQATGQLMVNNRETLVGPFEHTVVTGTAIEINSALARLDADAELLRRFRDSGVTVLINTDAHHHTEYDRLRWGVRHAQRGWGDKERIPNTWPRQRFMDWVQAHRP